MTNFTVSTGDDLVDTWNTLFGSLFARFRDGFTASPKAPAHPKDKPGTNCKEPGYDDAWKARIVADAGDKYAAWGPSGPDRLGAAPLIDPRLSRTRMKYV